MIKVILSIALGTLTSIITDFLLSLIGPIGGVLFYPKIIGVILGSFFAALIVKKRGWLTGILVSSFHIIYIIWLLSFWNTSVTEEPMAIDWLSLWPTGIIMLVAGAISGYFGEKASLRNK